MDILIPTLGRAHRQVTLTNLPEEFRKKAYLVVQHNDWEANWKKYNRHDCHKFVLPPEITTIAQTRKFLMECGEFDNKFITLDDDLVFAARREDALHKFRPMKDQDFQQMFSNIEAALDLHPLVGVSHREGANRNTNYELPYGRMMRVWGINRDILLSHRPSLGRIELMEDFDLILQLLRKGVRNPILNMWVHNQGGSDVSGGCSTYRTPELQTECANRLAELHPGFVKVVEKETKISWGGGKRTDVTVSWKKAYLSGGGK